MNVIERLAATIEQEPASEMESMCRYTVAAEMRREHRMLTADEIEDIVEDVVDEEAMADLESRYDEGEVEVTEAERDNIPVDEIVMLDEDGETVEGVVVGGRFARLVIVPDNTKRVISASISKHSEMLAHMANANEGVNLKSLYHPVPDVNMPCPRCSSRNVTPVWFDSGEAVACCNECGGEFEASIDEVAHATLAERTVEDVDILPEFEVFGSVWLQGDGYGYEVYASGDLVDSGEAETFEDVQERFDDIADAYDDIEEDAVIEFADGHDESVVSVDDDELIMESGKKASRIRVARIVADGKAFINRARVASFEVEAGMCYDIKQGSLVIDSVGSDGIYATLVSGTADGRVSERMARFTEKQLRELVGA